MNATYFNLMVDNMFCTSADNITVGIENTIEIQSDELNSIKLKWLVKNTLLG